MQIVTPQTVVQPAEPIQPYTCQDDSGNWYCVDQWGASLGPLSEEEATKALSSLSK